MDRNQEKVSLFGKRYSSPGIIGHNTRPLTAAEAERMILGAPYLAEPEYAKPQPWPSCDPEAVMIGGSPPPETED